MIKRRGGSSVLLFGAFALMMSGQPAGAADNIWTRDTLTGDWGGTRKDLSDHGVDITLDYIGETLGNVSGGAKEGWVYQGRAELSIDADFDRMFGWKGGSAHVTGYQIHQANGGIGANYVGSIGDPSNIEGRPSTRLFTLWLQQTLFDDKLSIRAGQLAADDEFWTSPTSGGLINGTFGWVDIMAANLPSGGAAYPLATPGVRVQVNPTPELAVLVAAFSGNPAGADCDQNPQICNKHGTTFSMDGGTFWIAEAQYGVNQGEGARGLPGIYKLGAWYQNSLYPDMKQGIDASGAPVSLASGNAVESLYHSGDQGIYAVADQTLWREQGGARSLSGFVRVGGTPSDRNTVSFYIDGGLGVTGLIEGREQDILTLGVAYAKISGDASDLDKATSQYNLDPSYPVRNQETVFELSYGSQITPWLIVQPDVQYIIHPGGNVPNPESATSDTVGNALIVGVRSYITF